MMKAETITIQAVVRSLDGNVAHVEVEHGGCGRCHEEGGCGGQQLTQMFCGGPKTYDVENKINAAIGDKVTIAIAAGNVRRTANLAYGLPLLATIAGASAGAALGGDLAAMGGALGALVVAFLYVIVRVRSGNKHMPERPYMQRNS